jgi:hypothetical protein
MENLNLKIVNKETEKEGFCINSDSSAEWAISKLREEKIELDRIEKLCKMMIQTYQQRIDEAKRSHESTTTWLKSQLQQYFETVPHKKTKTQETYNLASGKLVKKLGGDDYVRDDEKILSWIKNNKKEDKFIKIEESVKWAELKKTLTVSGNNAVDCDGEIIPGITVTQKPDKFEVQLD